MSASSPYPNALTEAASRASAAATRAWEQAAMTSRRGGRIVSAATIAWNAAYPVAYRHGYLALASRAAAAFSELQQQPAVVGTPQADAVGSLARLARRAQPPPMSAPPPTRRVLAVAAIAALDRLDGRTAPQAVTAAVHREAAKEGGIHGVLTAAADLTVGWRRHVDTALLATAKAGVTLEEHINRTLAGVNQDVIANWVMQGQRLAPTAASLAATSFAEPVTGHNTAPEIPHPPAPVVFVAARRRSRS